MFRKRKLLFTVVLMLLCCMAFGKKRSKGPVKIGFSIDSLKVERWQTDRDRFEKRAKELGATVTFESAEGDDDLQFEQSKKLIDSGISVLVIVPHNTQKAARIVDAAHAKGVKVLCYDRLIPNSDVDFYVGFDVNAIGRMQAESMMKAAPKGNYVILAGSKTDSNAISLRDAQMEVLKPAIDHGDIKVVADSYTKDWSPEEAYVSMTEAIEAAKGEIAAVVSSNDGMANSAVQALSDHKLAGKVAVSGQDADLTAIIHILEGTQTMTVYKPFAKEAAQAVDAAFALAKGRSVKGAQSVDNGKRNVPAILLAPIAVTKENVKDTVIKDGFQTVESIKRGLPKDKWSLIE